MHRYYMNSETREALIAESKRLIAARAAAASSRHGSLVPGMLQEKKGTEDDTGAISAFATLVFELTADRRVATPNEAVR